jgi:DcmR-like sensory protein
LLGGTLLATAAAMATTLGRSAMGEHALHLYEEEVTLTTTVASFLAPAFENDQAILAVATRPHLAAVEQRLRTIGHDVDGARRSGRYLAIDAERLLPRLMHNGLPSAEAFEAIVGSHVAQIGDRHGEVRAFGELVQLLWRDGKSNAALRLEDLWNDLLDDAPLSLICGYRVRTIGGHEGPRVDEIVRRHWSTRARDLAL